MTLQVLVGTNNAGKLAEYKLLFADLPIEIVSPREIGLNDDVPEDGATFEANAILKAEGYCRLSNLITVADDSGLEVDALGGAPGVLSARYAGPGATDADRYAKLLRDLAAVPSGQRTARFRCVIAIAVPSQPTVTVDGTCEGIISASPSGQHGFGYDPVFFVPSYGKTMAELPPETKNRISHRAAAATAAKPLLATIAKQFAVDTVY